MEDVSRIEIGKMPMTEEMVWKAFQRALLGYMWTLENRLRALEGKAAITRKQFLDAVKARLGL